MIGRTLAIAAAIAVVALSCRAIPAPTDGVLSVSEVDLPSPGVVVGDTLRDSVGNAAPLRVYAFGVGGMADTITNIAATFVLLDRGAHITADGYLIGDSVRTTPVRVVGAVGVLQTSAANVDVTPQPDSIGAASTTPIDTVRFNPLDSTASVNFSAALTVTVVGAGSPPPPITSVIVRYAIAYQPTASVAGAVSALLVNSTGAANSVDTTDVNGHAGPRVRVRPQAPTAPDSVVVTASASYRGIPLRGSPVRFVIPIYGSIPSSSRGR
ncbi:MAG TPA: hypothetical protein VIJ16_02755 [Gemmatimonadaceae bacterium]